jgi:predicted nucleotidyltransferase
MHLSDYQFLQEIAALDFVDAIYLFGSRARGDNRDRSDIDIAIQCPKATQKDWLSILHIVENADTLLMIDCIRLDEELTTSPLYQQIEEDKQLIYERAA